MNKTVAYLLDKLYILNEKSWN